MDKADLNELILLALSSLLAWNYYKNRIYKSSDKYSTFWPRFWAPSLDSLIFWPIGILAAFILSKNIFFLIAFPIYIVNNFIFYGYSIFMHARYGQTIGKMICKVKVVNYKTETPIGLRQALLRESINLFYSILLIGYELKFIIFGKYNFSDLQKPEVIKEMYGTDWTDFPFFLSISLILFLVEILTMLTNNQRRSLHDFIAGTVVIRTNLEK